MGEQRDHDDGAIAEEDGQQDGAVEPWESLRAAFAHVADGDGYGGDAFVAGELRVVCYARHYVAKEHVKYCADKQRAQYADRHVALGIFCLLGCCADSIEAEKGEENDGRAAHDARKAELAEHAGVLRKIGGIVGLVNVAPSQSDEKGNYGHFQEYYDAVEHRTSLCAAHKEETHCHDDESRRQVDDAAVPRAGRQCRRQVDAEVFEHDDEVAAP